MTTPNPNPERSREAREDTDTADGEQPSLADRVRNLFRGPSEPSTPDESPDNEDTTLPENPYPPQDRPVDPSA